MNFLSMKYFLAVVEEKSISAAARKLFISQQTLSEQMKKLEEEIGTPLFKRGRTISLTLAGESFAIGAKNMIGQYDTTMENIQDITANRHRRISVAIPTSMTPVALTDIVLSFRDKYPHFPAARAGIPVHRPAQEASPVQRLLRRILCRCQSERDQSHPQCQHERRSSFCHRLQLYRLIRRDARIPEPVSLS